MKKEGDFYCIGLRKLNKEEIANCKRIRKLHNIFTYRQILQQIFLKTMREEW